MVLPSNSQVPIVVGANELRQSGSEPRQSLRVDMI